MDLLAAIAADPTLLPLWAVMLFAAGMYPIGMMFGCSPCCQPCTACTQGSLPDTLTVALSGIPETTAGPDLVTLSFSGCYGWGGGGVVTAPSQSAVGSDLAEDRGSITAVSLTDGGSGYARLGRAAPSVSASVETYYGENGSGAVLDVTLTKAKDSCGLDYWAVNKITVANGGEGYSGESVVFFQAASGDVEESAAYAEITLEQPPPEATLAINSLSGSGAELSPPVFASGYWPGTYYIESVAVEDGGDGYTHLDEIEITLTNGEPYSYWSTAVLSLITANTEPTVTVSGGSGSGGVLNATLSASTSSNGSPIWSVASIAIQSAGSGYAFLDALSVTVDDGDPRSGGCTAYVWSVDGNGGITSVYIFDGGQYFKGGPVTGVSVEYGGDYLGQSTGKIASVTVTDGGRYYREDASLPPYVADVTVTINQTSPSDGDGAVITAQVEDDTGSPDFGKVVGLTIENGGDGYLAHELFASCLGRFNGRSIVVKRNYPFWTVGQCCPFFPMSISPESCTYGYVCANTSDPCSLEAEAVRVDYRGPNEPLTVFLMLHQRGQTNLPLGGGYYYPAAYGLLTANENVENCSDIDVNAYGSQWLPEEATANVTSGGEYQESDACKRISEEDMAAVYVDVTWGDITTSGSGSLCGWRSGAFSGNKSEDTTGQWCDSWRATVPARIDARMAGTSGYWANVRNIVSNCSETRNLYGVNFSIGRLSDCSWGWYPGGHLCVSVSRQLSLNWTYDNIYGPVVNPASGGRTCQWCYPIIGIPVDDNFMPSGDAVLGEPVYSGGSYPWQATAFWFDDLLSEASVCVNPGPPTITFSPLP